MSEQFCHLVEQRLTIIMVATVTVPKYVSKVAFNTQVLIFKYIYLDLFIKNTALNNCRECGLIGNDLIWQLVNFIKIVKFNVRIHLY